MMVEAVLFDFDDTLINYKVSEEYGLRTALEKCGVHVKDEFFQIYSEVNQRLWRLVEKGEISVAELRVRRFEHLIRETGIEIKLPPRELGDLYLHHFAEIGELEDGAREILSWMEKHPRLKKAMITNGFQDTQRRRIAVTRIGDFFDELFISGEMGVKKPDAAIFQQALEKLRIGDPSRALIVGDNLVSDIMGGKKSGLTTCWYNPGKKEAGDYRRFIDFEIDHLSELPLLPLFGGA